MRDDRSKKANRGCVSKSCWCTLPMNVDMHRLLFQASEMGLCASRFGGRETILQLWFRPYRLLHSDSLQQIDFVDF